MESKAKFNIGYFFMAFFLVILLRDAWLNYNTIVTIPYSEFQTQLSANNIAEITITEHKITGKLNNPIDSKEYFTTNRVGVDLAQILETHNVEYSKKIENHFLANLLSWTLPALFFFGIWWVLMKKMASKQGGLGGGFMSIGKSKAKIYVQQDTQLSFKDVAGVDEAKAELMEIIEFLKDSEKYSRLGGKMPKGILLIGPPGTGKTLLAKAVAGEAQVPFFSVSGSEFVEMFVGVGAARVRDLFEQAKTKAPCIIFIDELDALGKARMISPQSSNDEKEQTLNQLLVELDGFDTTSGIVLLAATNRPEILDPALLRAGRFDRQVLVDKPDKKGRLEILSLHCKNIHLAPAVKLEDIAAITPGFTGADLANLANEAALMATRRKANEVTLEDFNEAVERIVAGLEKKNRLLNPFERKVVAYHEMGHAIVTHCLGHTEEVHKISIIPRGVGALGYTIQRPTEERFLMTKQELMDKVSGLLGGRAAEQLIFNHLSTGGADDIAKATDIIRSLITRYGMDERLGPVSYEKENTRFLSQDLTPTGKMNYSEETARNIDSATQNLMEEAMKNALQVLEAHKEVLETAAQELLIKETLSEEELKPYFKMLKV